MIQEPLKIWVLTFSYISVTLFKHEIRKVLSFQYFVGLEVMEYGFKSLFLRFLSPLPRNIVKTSSCEKRILSDWDSFFSLIFRLMNCIMTDFRALYLVVDNIYWKWYYVIPPWKTGNNSWKMFLWKNKKSCWQRKIRMII